MTKAKSAATVRREKLVKEFWPNEDAWTGDNEVGWFRAPRTLPLIIGVLGLKDLSGNLNPTNVYVELLARHMDNGLVEMGPDADHAYAAGYDGERGVRSWRERMHLLEKLGVIKTKKIGNQSFKYVLLVHPTAVIHRLRLDKRISDHWWATYRARQIETKELFYEDRERPKALAATKSAGRGKAAKSGD